MKKKKKQKGKNTFHNIVLLPAKNLDRCLTVMMYREGKSLTLEEMGSYLCLLIFIELLMDLKRNQVSWIISVSTLVIELIRGCFSLTRPLKHQLD